MMDTLSKRLDHISAKVEANDRKAVEANEHETEATTKAPVNYSCPLGGGDSSSMGRTFFEREARLQRHFKVARGRRRFTPG
jgi:hypothetical protein